MLNDATCSKAVCIVCGCTDLRAGMERPAALVETQTGNRPYIPDTLYLFCGRRTDRIKGLVLSYQLKAARRELADFRSGEIYRKMRADYEGVIRELNLTVKKLRRERDDFSFPGKRLRGSGWMCLGMSRKNMKKRLKN